MRYGQNDHLLVQMKVPLKIKRDFEKWKRFTCKSLMIMKHAIPETLRGAMFDEDNAKKFLGEMKKRFAKCIKVV